VALDVRSGLFQAAYVPDRTFLARALSVVSANRLQLNVIHSFDII
jgi:hypothetical protein